MAHQVTIIVGAMVSQGPRHSMPAPGFWLRLVAIGLIVGSTMIGCGLQNLEAAEAGSNADLSHDRVDLAVQAMVAEAWHAQQAGDFERARDLYHQALLYQPDNIMARQNLASVEAVLDGKDQAQSGPRDIGAVTSQAARSIAIAAIARAEVLVRENHDAEAQDQLIRARQELEPLAGAAGVNAQLSRIDALLADVQTRNREARAENAVHGRVAAQSDSQNDQVSRAHVQDSVFAERVARIKAIRDRKDYELALAACRHLITDFPDNAQANRLFDELVALVHAQRHLDQHQRLTELRQEIFERIHREFIPIGFDGLPIYPSDWAARHQERTAIDPGSSLPPWQLDLLNRLSQRVTFEFDDLELIEALSFLKKQGGFNLIIDPSIFTTGDRKVQLKGQDMRIDHVLDWLAQMAGTQWVVTKGAVYFGGQAGEPAVLVTYDVSSLVFDPSDQPGHVIGYGANGGGGGAGGAAQGTFDLFQEQPDTTKKAGPEDFVDLIQKAVAPGAWTGTTNAITIHGNILFVTAPPAVQRLVDQFIRSQDNARNVMVHIDARWLTIMDDYLEEIGINWGGAQSLLQVNGQSEPGYSRSSQTSAFNGSVINTLPANASQLALNAANGGLNLSFLRLSTDEISSVFQAIELKHVGRVLASPSLATINGLQGDTFFGTQIAYISSYTVVNSLLQPTISVLNIGADLHIKPFVSADGKYVTMDFEPSVATVRMFQDVIMAPINLPNAVFPPGTPAPPITVTAYPIDLPNVALQEAATRIMIPDKGSILVGGFGHHLEQRSSTEVPFVGHIPFLGRLLGRRGRYSERSQLYLLANVNIINYDEAEAHL